MEQGTIENFLYPLEEALSHLPKYVINDKVAEKVKNGAVLPLPENNGNWDGPIVVENEAKVALAIYAKHPNKPGLMKPVKVLRNNQL
jgi:tRNA pseudouridine55 synthase